MDSRVINQEELAKLMSDGWSWRNYGASSGDSSGVPIYRGAYEVTPSVDTSQKLYTANRLMTKNVTVDKVPFHNVSNIRGGSTVYIGVIDVDQSVQAVCGTVLVGQVKCGEV